MNTILLIDGNSLANRAYYALPYFSDPKGRPTGAVYGFLNILIKVITELRPDGIIVAFDHSRKTFRSSIYAEYKSNRRQTPEDLKSQFPILKDLLKLMKITVIEQDGIEADDIIGSCDKQLSGKKIILTGDRDLLQLIDNDTEVWLTQKGISVVNKLNEAELKNQFGLRPSQIIELKGLMGDPSDNIPGVTGVGERTALKLLNTYDNIDNLYENIDFINGTLHEKLVRGKNSAFMSKQLATIVTDAKLEENINDYGYEFPFSQAVQESFKNLAFTSLLKRSELFLNYKPFIETTRICLNNDVIAQAFLSQVKGALAYNLQKMEFSLKLGEVYYISQSVDMFSSAPTMEEMLVKLKDVFESDKVLKITTSAKEDMHALAKLGIKLNNFFDLNLACYLLHAGETMPTLPSSADEYFDCMEEFKKSLNEQALEQIYQQIELPLARVLFEMEENGFKINEQALDELDEDFSSKLEHLREQICEEAGEEFNINSPKQVAHILFDKLMLKSYYKKDSTGKDVLSELKYSHPIVQMIIDYRKYQKIKSTYIEVYKRLCAERGNIIHTSFNQTQTATGRLSSSDPNLQNIPLSDDDGRNIRKIFVSQFDGGKILSADYSQIELRLLADMSGEEKLISIFNSGEDVHTQTACQIFGVKPEEITIKQRREAKAVNFGVIYGMSDFGLSQSLGVPRKNARNYIDSYFARYPNVKKFNDDNIAFARKNGYIKTKYGRIRHIPEINSSNHMMRSSGERKALNMPLQGTASDIIKMSMIDVASEMQKQNLKSKLILQIHDELIFDVFPGEEEEVRNIVLNKMQNVVKLSVPLLISVGSGKNLYECK